MIRIWPVGDGPPAGVGPARHSISHRPETFENPAAEVTIWGDNADGPGRVTKPPVDAVPGWLNQHVSGATTVSVGRGTTRGAEGVRGRLARDRTGMTILRGAGRRCGIRHLRALGGAAPD